MVGFRHEWRQDTPLTFSARIWHQDMAWMQHGHAMNMAGLRFYTQ